MNRIFSLLVTFVPFFTFAQQSANVQIKFSGAKERQTTVQLPVDGLNFYPNRKALEFDKDSMLVIKFDPGKIANLFITNSGRSFRFLIEPGNYKIDLNLALKGAEAVSFNGKNEEGQVQLNAIKKIFTKAEPMGIIKKDNTVEGFSKLLATDKEKDIEPFKQLLLEKKVSQTFFSFIARNIELDYIAIATHIPISVYFSSLRDSSIVFSEELKTFWGKMYENYPFDEKYMHADEFYFHAQYYAGTYIGFFLAQQKGVWQKPSADPNVYLKKSYEKFEENFKGVLESIYWPIFFFSEMFQKKYQTVLVELYENFKIQYPNSKFSAYLKQQAEEIINYHKLVKEDFKPDQRFVSNYANINSFEDLMGHFKDKVVFIDMWATWCGPCKAEFEYGEELEKFIKNKGAEMLYISMDKDAADQQWKEMIKYYKLSGTHIRVNELLIQDLMKLFWDGKGYAIPRYVIVKNGKIAVPKALRPSDKQLLYEQINSYL